MKIEIHRDLDVVKARIKEATAPLLTENHRLRDLVAAADRHIAELKAAIAGAIVKLSEATVEDIYGDIDTDARVAVVIADLRKLVPQPFRAGDVVEVVAGSHCGEHWVVACYDAERDELWCAGWPETLVTQASLLRTVKPHRAATDKQHADMVESVSKHEGRGSRGSAMRAILARGGTP